jgi:hypothetical protein
MSLKLINIYSAFILFACTQTVSAQEIITCEDDDTTYWVITNNNIHYSVSLHGDIAKSKTPDLLNVEDMALQYIILDKEGYTDKKEENTDISILVRYVSSEAEYLSGIFPDSFEIQTQTGKTASGKEFLLWQYKIPEGRSKEVISQFFVNTIIGDKIFGLGSPQFIDHNPDTIKKFLTSTLDTLAIVKNIDSLCEK